MKLAKCFVIIVFVVLTTDSITNDRVVTEEDKINNTREFRMFDTTGLPQAGSYVTFS